MGWRPPPPTKKNMTEVKFFFALENFRDFEIFSLIFRTQQVLLYSVQYERKEKGLNPKDSCDLDGTGEN